MIQWVINTCCKELIYGTMIDTNLLKSHLEKQMLFENHQLNKYEHIFSYTIKKIKKEQTNKT